MRKYPGIIIAILCCVSCGNNIQTADTLSKKDLTRLHSLNILDSNERVYKFYSEFKNSVAGNFYTDKRLASYWLDERDQTKNTIQYAFYNDITRIDTVYYAGATYCPYMNIVKKNGSSFKVCVDGSKKEIEGFFNDAIGKWKQHEQQ